MNKYIYITVLVKMANRYDENSWIFVDQSKNAEFAKIECIRLNKKVIPMHLYGVIELNLIEDAERISKLRGLMNILEYVNHLNN